MSEATAIERQRSRKTAVAASNSLFGVYQERSVDQRARDGYVNIYQRNTKKLKKNRAPKSRLGRLLHRGDSQAVLSNLVAAQEIQVLSSERKIADQAKYLKFLESFTLDIESVRALPELTQHSKVELETLSVSAFRTYMSKWFELSVVSYCDLAGLQASSKAEIASNESLPIEQRSTALLDWLESEKEDASCYLLSELESTNNEAWQSWLVLLSEDTWFDDPKDRARLIEKLLEIAKSRSLSRVSTDELVVRKALRRAGMLLPADRLPELLQFTHLASGIKAEVLGVFRAVLEIDQPSGKLEDSMNRIRELALTYANPDVYSMGPIDSMLFDALVTLAILGDAKLVEVLASVKSLARPFLLNQLSQTLSKLIESSSFPIHGRQEIHRALREIEQLVAPGN
ncbi:MAG: hypothetical protein ACK56W_17710 [Pirellula sp.]